MQKLLLLALPVVLVVLPLRAARTRNPLRAFKRLLLGALLLDLAYALALQVLHPQLG